MNTDVITIRTDPGLKTSAQRLARELGFTLSSLVTAYLKQFVRTKTVSFSHSEEPSEYLVHAIQEAERERKEGWVSPTFDRADDAIAWLRSKRKTYARHLQQAVQ